MAKPKKKMTAAERAAARVPEIPDPAKEAAHAAVVEQVTATKSYRRRRFALLIGGLAALVLLSFTLWTCNYSHENDVAREALVPTEQVAVDNQSEWTAFGNPTAEVGYVFYPGGKVAAEAYAPLMRDLAGEGLFCIIVKVPFNLAFLDTGAADGVLSAYPQVKTWYVGGHSLGGVAACQWVEGNADKVAGIILMGSYPSVDLTGADVRLLSIYGTNDLVMNRENYEESKVLRPADTQEAVIQGGNHAQFGEYGTQDGDGEAAIPAEEQRRQTVDAIMKWLASAS